MKIYLCDFSMSQRSPQTVYVSKFSSFKLGIKVEGATEIKLYDGNTEITADASLFNGYKSFSITAGDASRKDYIVKADGSDIALNVIITDSNSSELSSGSGGGSEYVLPTASSTTLGGVKINGNNIAIDANGVLSAAGGSSYELPTATASTLGGVKVGDEYSGNGVIIGTDNQTLKVECGTGLQVGPSGVELKTANTTTIGGVKPDGTTITIDAYGTIHAQGSGGSQLWQEYGLYTVIPTTTSEGTQITNVSAETFTGAKIHATGYDPDMDQTNLSVLGKTVFTNENPESGALGIVVKSSQTPYCTTEIGDFSITNYDSLSGFNGPYSTIGMMSSGFIRQIVNGELNGQFMILNYDPDTSDNKYFGLQFDSSQGCLLKAWDSEGSEGTQRTLTLQLVQINGTTYWMFAEEQP